jgi:5-methyltetrahydrofolate--homocysteine methyltransferase
MARGHLPRQLLVERTHRQFGEHIERDALLEAADGAPINQQWADEIGAEGYSPDAAQAVRDAKKLLQVAV